MKTGKIMAWIDELPGVAGTEYPGRRDGIAELMAEAAELTRKAEELRSRAYFNACGLEGDTRRHWTAEQIEQAKHRAG